MASYYDIWQPNFWLDTFWPEEYWYSDDAEYAGSLTPTLADVTSALVGETAEPGATDGFIAVTLGGVSASLMAGSATTIVFDLPVNLSVNWHVYEQGLFAGTIAPTLGDLSGSLSGIAWEQSYTSGLIQAEPNFWHPLLWGDAWAADFWPVLPQLEGVTASFEGTLATPGSYVGQLGASLEALSSTVLGSIYPPTNYRGAILANVGGLTGAFAGTHIDPIQTGAIAASLDGITGLVQGLVIASGSFVGRLNPALDGITGLAYGQVFIPPRYGTVTTTFDGVASTLSGLSLPEGGKILYLRSTLTGVGGLLAGSMTAPRARERAAVPTVTEIDWKTLCDQHNVTAVDEYDYEFSNGRRFKQG